MFSKAVYSKLEFSAPMSRKKMSNFNFFFQNGFLAVSVYPVTLKNSISFEWCKSGALLVPFIVSANKLTWQFTVPDADRWYSHWTQVLKNKLSSLSPQYKTAHIISPSHPWTSPNILCSANEYPPATVILANPGKRNPSYGTEWNWKKCLQDLPHRESSGKRPGGPALPSQFIVTSKDYPVGLS